MNAGLYTCVDHSECPWTISSLHCYSVVPWKYVAPSCYIKHFVYIRPQALSVSNDYLYAGLGLLHLDWKQVAMTFCGKCS